jgi:WXG100 family type VII secretion target
MADANNIYVNYNSTNNVIDDLSSANSQIQQQLDDLQTTIQGLQATWSGASNSEYTVAQTRWNNDMTQMQGMLPVYSQTLHNMSSNYGTTDNRLANMWASTPHP